MRNTINKLNFIGVWNHQDGKGIPKGKDYDYVTFTQDGEEFKKVRHNGIWWTFKLSWNLTDEEIISHLTGERGLEIVGKHIRKQWRKNKITREVYDTMFEAKREIDQALSTLRKLTGRTDVPRYREIQSHLTGLENMRDELTNVLRKSEPPFTSRYKDFSI